MLSNYLQTLNQTTSQINIADFNSMSDLVEKANSIFVIGNGGSYAIAEHFCTDLIKFCHKDARSLSNGSLLTMSANDYGYSNIFSSFAPNTDLVFALSTSGQSENIVNAMCQFYNAKKILLCGFGGRGFKTKIDCKAIIPNSCAQILEDSFSIICHALTLEVKLRIGAKTCFQP